MLRAVRSRRTYAQKKRVRRIGQLFLLIFLMLIPATSFAQEPSGKQGRQIQNVVPDDGVGYDVMQGRVYDSGNKVKGKVAGWFRNYTGDVVTNVTVNADIVWEHNGQQDTLAQMSASYPSIGEERLWVGLNGTLNSPPDPGYDGEIVAYIEVNADGHPTSHAMRVLADYRNDDDMEQSLHLRNGLCDLDIKINNDPHVTVMTLDGQIVAQTLPDNPLPASKWWSQAFGSRIDLTPFATWPATDFSFIVQAQWDGFDDLYQTETIHAEHMDCLDLTGSISGRKLSENDQPVSGVTIELHRDDNGWELEASDVTDSNGDYSFEIGEPGIYRVAEIVPADWEPIGPTVSGPLLIDGDHLEWHFDFQNKPNAPDIQLGAGCTSDPTVSIDSIDGGTLDITFVADNGTESINAQAVLNFSPGQQNATVPWEDVVDLFGMTEFSYTYTWDGNLSDPTTENGTLGHDVCNTPGPPITSVLMGCQVDSVFTITTQEPGTLQYTFKAENENITPITVNNMVTIDSAGQYNYTEPWPVALDALGEYSFLVSYTWDGQYTDPIVQDFYVIIMDTCNHPGEPQITVHGGCETDPSITIVSDDGGDLAAIFTAVNQDGTEVTVEINETGVPNGSQTYSSSWPPLNLFGTYEFFVTYAWDGTYSDAIGETLPIGQPDVCTSPDPPDVDPLAGCQVSPMVSITTQEAGILSVTFKAENDNASPVTVEINETLASAGSQSFSTVWPPLPALGQYRFYAKYSWDGEFTEPFSTDFVLLGTGVCNEPGIPDITVQGNCTTQPMITIDSDDGGSIEATFSAVNQDGTVVAVEINETDVPAGEQSYTASWPSLTLFGTYEFFVTYTWDGIYSDPVSNTVTLSTPIPCNTPDDPEIFLAIGCTGSPGFQITAPENGDFHIIFTATSEDESEVRTAEFNGQIVAEVLTTQTIPWNGPLTKLGTYTFSYWYEWDGEFTEPYTREAVLMTDICNDPAPVEVTALAGCTQQPEIQVTSDDGGTIEFIFTATHATQLPVEVQGTETLEPGAFTISSQWPVQFTELGIYTFDVWYRWTGTHSPVVTDQYTIGTGVCNQPSETTITAVDAGCNVDPTLRVETEDGGTLTYSFVASNGDHDVVVHGVKVIDPNSNELVSAPWSEPLNRFGEYIFSYSYAWQANFGPPLGESDVFGSEVCREAIPELVCTGVSASITEAQIPFTTIITVEFDGDGHYVWLNSSSEPQNTFGEFDEFEIPITITQKGEHTFTAYISTLSTGPWVTSVDESCVVEVVGNDTPEHQPFESQIVNTFAGQLDELERIDQLAKTDPNAAKLAREDFYRRFGDLSGPEGRVGFSEVPAFRGENVYPERFLCTSYPSGDANGSLDKGIPGRGYGTQFDQCNRIPTEIRDMNLYIRLDETANAGGVMLMTRANWGSVGNGAYGESYRPQATDILHVEFHATYGDVFNYTLDISEKATQLFDTGTVQHMNFTAESMYRIGVLWGVFPQDLHQAFAWNNCTDQNPNDCGRINGVQNMDPALGWYWPTYQDEIMSFPSQPLVAVTYPGITATYFGFYGLSGIEFSFGDPFSPSTMFWDQDGNLLISQERYAEWLAHFNRMYWIDQEGIVRYNTEEVKRFEMFSAWLAVQYDLPYVQSVPAHLQEVIGSSGNAIDYALIYLEKTKAEAAVGSAVQANTELEQYVQSGGNPQTQDLAVRRDELVRIANAEVERVNPILVRAGVSPVIDYETLKSRADAATQIVSTPQLDWKMYWTVKNPGSLLSNGAVTDVTFGFDWDRFIRDGGSFGMVDTQTYCVHVGETYDGIARAFNTTAGTLMRLNGGVELVEGMCLLIGGGDNYTTVPPESIPQGWEHLQFQEAVLGN